LFITRNWLLSIDTNKHVGGADKVSEQIPVKDNREIKSHHWLSPIWQTLTPQHSKIYGRYQTARIVVDFGAAFCFVAGSVFFLISGTAFIATALFLAGSLLFSVKPTIDLVRAFHLRRI
jgi:hypothetical protein